MFENLGEIVHREWKSQTLNEHSFQIVHRK